MKKIIALALALCFIFSLTIGQAEMDTGLLDEVFSGIEDFDPNTDELLAPPAADFLKSTAVMKSDINVFGIDGLDIEFDTLGSNERNTYLPTAGLLLGLFEALGVSYSSQNIEVYAEADDYYMQWWVEVIDNTLDKVFQLWWTPGLNVGEAYYETDDNDNPVTVNAFWNTSNNGAYIRNRGLQALNTGILTNYVNMLLGTGDTPLTVGKAEYRISNDRQHIYITKPPISGGSGMYSIAYNIYDDNSEPVNYFYSDEQYVAATPGYGGRFNVFIVVKDSVSGETNTQNIDWQQLKWPYADSLTVGQVGFELSPDRKSIFLTRPSIACKGGDVTIAYNIYDSNSNPVNYFYSNRTRVAATPGYDGRFNVFVVVTDTVTGEQNTQDIGWVDLGGSLVTGTFRALVVGNSDFVRNNDLICCKYDADHMVSMLNTINGGAYSGHVKRLDNSTASTLQSNIRSAYSGAQQNDVSLFYVSSHGVVYESGTPAAYAGAVAMSDDNTVLWRDLASWLSSANPNNKVIVLIDTCGSGGPVTAASSSVDDEINLRAILSAFAAVDKPIVTKGVRGQEKLGELRTSQFEVISACRANETSVGYSNGSLFTNSVISGIGSSGSMPADTDGDGIVTTYELYNYTYDKCKSSHHPVVWPSGSTYPLFWR